ncbi:MAG: tRNA uridine-5-carboxymethylaminomethyl(34) synthesis GTPase MnmE [Bacteroidales bacterium]|nr:tRNA uridine-5-carboxymethylaminomethyl(34) synthesis GTPase MnmE [Bacteroidales bacterium]
MTATRNTETICAISTPQGVGGIAVVRISGRDAKTVCNKVLLSPKGSRVVESFAPNTAHFCCFCDGDKLIDEVVATYFENPRSYTGEDCIEISCHGSLYVQQKVMETLVAAGARLAEPGEFTLRGFLNGKFDLSQAEAVADLIDSNSEASHGLAIHQLRGGFSKSIANLREKFVNLASLMELELDFSDEDVEFADRSDLMNLLNEIETQVASLTNSFRLGNAVKNGVPVAIVGKPNVGKSTLLNALLNEDRAIVSDIPGTTRDTIEDAITIDGITFRFIDTAGIRQSDNEIENYGIERTYKAIEKAAIVIRVVDIQEALTIDLKEMMESEKTDESLQDKHFVLVINKSDILTDESSNKIVDESIKDCIFISAKEKKNIEVLTRNLVDHVKAGRQIDNTLLTNARHYEAFLHILEAVKAVRTGIDSSLPGDLLMVDVRQSLYYLGLITGQVTSDELLGNIFGRFCIGK